MSGSDQEALRRIAGRSGASSRERRMAARARSGSPAIARALPWNPQAWVVPHTEVADDTSMLARIHDPAFDPRTTALVDSPLACEGAAEGEPGQVEILRDGGNRIEAQVQGGGGLLVFSEVDYPGWRATVDGNPARLVRADYLLRALCVPAGEHQVVLVYAPPLPKIGLAITGLTLLSIVGIAVWTSRRRGGDA